MRELDGLTLWGFLTFLPLLYLFPSGIQRRALRALRLRHQRSLQGLIPGPCYASDRMGRGGGAPEQGGGRWGAGIRLHTQAAFVHISAAALGAEMLC